MVISKVIIVINRSKPHAQPTAKVLREVLTRERVKMQWVEALPPSPHLFRSLGDLRKERADLIIACGGDGTLLQTAHRVRGTGIPILGINIGYLGFITSLRGDEVSQALGRILRMEFVVSHRTALDVSILRGKKPTPGWALNDVLITRGANPHIIGLSAQVGQRPLTHYRCDGLIVATPTGSTAYSLAAGGPIISPECRVLTVTPICPQSLTNRSVVLNSTEPIEIKLDPTSGPGDVQVDGMFLAKATPQTVLQIQSSAEEVPIAFLPEINYYDILAEKLNWRGDGLSKPRYGAR
ncbi:MAG TPA: NAD(+)/NADH kinase [Verrucomicrobiae bacterium]|jgi:NAD+ kinase|nr:NAD(+)/NADH kinase [Verrucomicrobiae bacterium]